MRAAAHLGAQGRLVRGFADRCEESLFKEPLADNKDTRAYPAQRIQLQN